jgi:hypothetical protein
MALKIHLKNYEKFFLNFYKKAQVKLLKAFSRKQFIPIKKKLLEKLQESSTKPFQEALKIDEKV